MRQYFPVLTIAGSDSSGGAGIQADIKTMSAIGCYAMSAITSITAQNTTGVRSIQPILPQIVTDQIEMVVADIPPLAIKTGMLCDAEVSRAVIDCLTEMSRRGTLRNLVVDPVMVSTSGSQLLEDEAIDIIVEKLLPLAEIVTPNRMEAVRLTGESPRHRHGVFGKWGAATCCSRVATATAPMSRPTGSRLTALTN